MPSSGTRTMPSTSFVVPGFARKATATPPMKRCGTRVPESQTSRSRMAEARGCRVSGRATGDPPQTVPTIPDSFVACFPDALSGACGRTKEQVECSELLEALLGGKGLRLPSGYGVHGDPTVAKLPRIESGEEVHGTNDAEPCFRRFRLTPLPRCREARAPRARAQRAVGGGRGVGDAGREERQFSCR